MRRRHLLRSLLITVVAAVVLAAPTLARAVDVVLTDDQLIQAGLCAGTGCGTTEDFPRQPIMSKNGNTPGMTIHQTTALGYSEYIWDVAGNEANFFVRDSTVSPARLVFRIRPSALANQLDLRPNGVTEFAGVATQSSARTAVAADDGSTILAALRNLAFQRYSVPGDVGVHFSPIETEFNSAFGVGSNGKVAFTDMAAISLAAVKALDARVSMLEPGPTGPVGPAGPQGAPGVNGTQGAAGTSASPDQLAAANKRIAALERTNKAQARALATLQKQMKRALAKR